AYSVLNPTPFLRYKISHDFFISSTQKPNGPPGVTKFFPGGRRPHFSFFSFQNCPHFREAKS
ncbi:MAG: hypothetical protein ABIH39_00875, partial [Candidatus Margulisiibacteriota bacterium]